MFLKMVTSLIATATIIGIASGCSLAVDQGQEVSIPIRKYRFEINAPAVDRLKDVVNEHQPAL